MESEHSVTQHDSVTLHTQRMYTLRKACEIRVIQTDFKLTSPCPKFIVLPHI